MAPDATFVFIYGPPAVGKLTVAQRLANRTGYSLLHNHLVIDAITPLFPFGTDGFFELTRRFRSALYETAAREGVDVILTYGYTPDDQPVVEEYVNVIEQHGGRLVYVQLVARRETLAARVALADRQEHGKIADAETLAEVLTQWDFSQAVPTSRTCGSTRTRWRPTRPSIESSTTIDCRMTQGDPSPSYPPRPRRGTDAG